MSEENLDRRITDTNVGGQGAPTLATNVGTPQPTATDPTTSPEQTPAPAETHPEVLNAAPSIMRTADEKITVDDNFNVDYTLKNGKKLKVSVVKPDLGVSTRLSDAQLLINEDANGHRYLMINNSTVYSMIMSEIIRVVQVDGAPLHTVNFKSLSKIGITKSELDDLMSIIVTFYLED